MPKFRVHHEETVNYEEVSGGVAEITSQPEGVEVEIIDHDNA